MQGKVILCYTHTCFLKKILEWEDEHSAVLLLQSSQMCLKKERQTVNMLTDCCLFVVCVQFQMIRTAIIKMKIRCLLN